MMNVLVCVLQAQQDMESALYGIHALAVFVSEISLLRFQKHVLNIRTRARFINESIHVYTVGFIGDNFIKI